MHSIDSCCPTWLYLFFIFVRFKVHYYDKNVNSDGKTKVGEGDILYIVPRHPKKQWKLRLMWRGRKRCVTRMEIWRLVFGGLVPSCHRKRPINWRSVAVNVAMGIHVAACLRRYVGCSHITLLTISSLHQQCSLLTIGRDIALAWRRK